jgi:hypothetical protein
MTRRQSDNDLNGGIAAHPAPPQKFRVQNTTLKVLASIFCGQDSILIYYLPNFQIINAEYYSSLLVQLYDILIEKRRGKVSKVFLYL